MKDWNHWGGWMGGRASGAINRYCHTNVPASLFLCFLPLIVFSPPPVVQPFVRFSRPPFPSFLLFHLALLACRFISILPPPPNSAPFSCFAWHRLHITSGVPLFTSRCPSRAAELAQAAKSSTWRSQGTVLQSGRGSSEPDLAGGL